MSLWILYLITVLTGWQAGRYLFLHDVGHFRTSWMACLCPFVPIVNLLIIAVAIADIVINRRECVENAARKFYCVKPEAPLGQGPVPPEECNS